MPSSVEFGETSGRTTDAIVLINPMRSALRLLSGSTAGSAPPTSLPRWTILSVTTLGAFMSALDSNIVTIALPNIAKDLSAQYSLLGWVLAGYVLAVAALVLQAGKFGDNLGKKRIYLIGFAAFGISSALCGLSQNIDELIVFRFIQGLGASAMLATGIPLIFASFPPSERGMAIGVNSIAWALGAVLGPLIGGVLTAIDWRLIFYVNVPVAALAIIVGRLKIPSALNAKSPFAGKINFVSATILGVAIGLIMFWLTLLDVRYAILGAIGVVAFVVAEARSKNPLLSRELLRNRGFVFSAVALAVMMVSFFGIVFLMSFYFQSVAGFSPLVAGVWVAPLPLALGIVNPLSGRMFDRFSRPAIMAIVGAFIVIGAVFLLSLALKNTSPGLTIALLLAVIGIGGGLVWSPTISGALAFARPEMRGVANGTAFTMIYVGFATSVSLVVSVSTSSLPAALSAAIQSGALTGLTGAAATSFDQGLINALLVLAVVGIIGVPFLFMVLREQVRQRRSPAAASSDNAAPTAAM